MILQAVKQDLLSYLKRAVVYTALFAVIITSSLVHMMTESYSNDILGSIDYYLMVSPLLLENRYWEDSETYHEKETRFLEFYDDIKCEIPVEYTDLCGSAPYAMPVYVREGETDDVYYLLSKSDAFDNAMTITADDSELINGPLGFHDMQGDAILTDRYIHFGRIRFADNSDFSNLHFDDITINMGRSFTEDEIERGEAVCIVPADAILYDGDSARQLPRGNWTGEHIVSINPGDTIELHVILFEDNSTAEIVELEVIGKYAFIDDDFHSIDGNTIVLGSHCSIIIPYKLAKSIEEKILDYDLLSDDIRGGNQLLNIEPALFKCTTLEDLDELIDYIERSELYQNGEISYYATTYEYSSFISSMMSFSKSIHTISLLAVSIAIISTILMNVVQAYQSRKNLFLYYSFGKRKEKTAFDQALIEGTVSLLSFLAALVLSLGMTHLLSKRIFEHYDGFAIDETYGIFSKNASVKAFNITEYLTAGNCLKTIAPYFVLIFAVILISYAANLLILKRVYYRSVLNESE